VSDDADIPQFVEHFSSPVVGVARSPTAPHKKQQKRRLEPVFQPRVDSNDPYRLETI
jgi:hypothetical protein